jgi:hypothetical protein
MSTTESNRRVFGAGTFIFALVAAVLAFAALFVAAEAYSRSNDAKAAVRNLASQGVVPSATKVTLEEFAIAAHPSVVKAGKVTIDSDNVGSVTHEMVLVRAPDVAALPRVTKATKERAVGDVDEEAIPEADKMGETGDVAPQKHVTKTFDLPPGTYVMFCNIDNTGANGTVTNHFQHGMSAVLVAQ